MNFYLAGINVRISFLFIALLATMLLINDRTIVYYGLISAFIHEASHLIIYYIFFNKPKEINFHITGIKAIKQSRLLCYNKEIIMLLGGSLSNIIVLLLCLFLNKYLLFGYVNLFLGAFNLLPIGNFDGGQILSLLLKKHNKPIIIKKIISIIFCVLIVLTFVLKIDAFNNNLTLLISGVYIFVMIFTDK